MTMTTNNNTQKAPIQNIYILARNGNVAFGSYQYDENHKFLHKAKHFACKNAATGGYMALAKLVNELTEAGKRASIYAFNDAAAFGKRFQKIIRTVEDEEEQKAMLQALVTEYKASDKYSDEETKEYQDARQAFHDALLKANEKGLAPIVYFLSERNKKTLTVPQGVQLKEGQLLSFYNGRTYNGIVVNGYATLRSRGIPVIKEVDKASGRVFWKIYAPENNDVKKLVSSLYAACPMPEREEVEIVMEEVAAA